VKILVTYRSEGQPYQASFELSSKNVEKSFKIFANKKISNYFTIKTMEEEYVDHITPIRNSSDVC
jgi:hypothetical protein